MRSKKAKVEESSQPPLGEIRMIVGGGSTGQSSKSKKTYLKVVQKVQLSGRSPKTRTTDEQAIIFTDEDALRIHHPYDDAIVITLLITDYSTRRVLVDNESLADILYYPAFQQMNLGREQLRPVHSPLVGFGGMKVQPVGTISLPVVVGAYPQQVTRNVNFLVVDCSSSYNAIIGRPTLNSWKVITSTYHLSVKFPTEYGVGEVQGDQPAARECYLAMLAMDEQTQTMNIEERNSSSIRRFIYVVQFDGNDVDGCSESLIVSESSHRHWRAAHALVVNDELATRLVQVLVFTCIHLLQSLTRIILAGQYFKFPSQESTKALHIANPQYIND